MSLPGGASNSWCLSSRALYDWTLLGLWERMELGEVLIAPPRRQRRGHPWERGQGRETGLLLAGDPPCVAQLLVGPERRKLMWVCARNYGWRAGDPSTEGAEIVRRLVAAVTSASLSLAHHRLGGWCSTVGAMAFRAWRSQHLKGSIYVANDSISARFADAAGSGGRVQAVRGGSRHAGCYAVDARSLYPALCATGRVPVRLCATHLRAGPAQAHVHSDPGACVAVVRVRTREPIYPRRERGRSDYPVGDYVTTLAGPELEMAVKSGHIREVMEAQVYECEPVLESFARATYAMRAGAEKAGEATTATLAKALGVSLVGKLSQRVQSWEECTPDYADPWWGEWWGADAGGKIVRYRSLAGNVSRQLDAGLAPLACPMMASWIWSAGRVWLWERMACAGQSEVLYCDTDGMIVTGKGYRRLEKKGYIRDNEWGELRKLIGPAPCEVHGPKCVKIGDKTIMAGAPTEQRQAFAETPGYWFRRPFKSDPESWLDGQWVEEWRDYGSCESAE